MSDIKRQSPKQTVRREKRIEGALWVQRRAERGYDTDARNSKKHIEKKEGARLDLQGRPAEKGKRGPLR